MLFYLFLMILFIKFFQGRDGENKRGQETSTCERNIDWLLLVHLGVGCPDRKLNQQHFGSLAHTQSTEPHQPGL